MRQPPAKQTVRPSPFNGHPLTRYFFEALLKWMQHQEALHVNHCAIDTIERSTDERRIHSNLSLSPSVSLTH